MNHLILSILLLVQSVAWTPKQQIPYGFAPGTPGWLKKSAQAQLLKWQHASGFKFVYEPKFKHYYDEYNGILFCAQGNGQFGTSLFGVTGVAHTEDINCFTRVEKIDLNVYLYHFHAGDPYFVPTHGRVADSPDVNRVLLNEIGTALGLKPSTDPGAIMFPYLHDGNCEIQADDLRQLRELYGE